MRRLSAFSLALVTALAAGSATLLLEREAEACGGCFAPPQDNTLVTDHRMILSVSKTKTTLYDQIRYQGDPSSFAWVLPVSGEVEFGLSADLLFSTIDQQTTTALLAPPANCPYRPSSCKSSSFGDAEDSAAAPSAGNGGVQVSGHEVVGPYEKVQLSSSDADALNAWLAKNGYNVPDAVKPVIAKYVEGKFDFVAIKLVPGKGVRDMQPVRVTTPGAAAVLPLRMVAAGAGANVGITLWVVGEGRYEPQNFPSFQIPTSDLIWDWGQGKSNYLDLRAQRAAAGNGRAWEVESSASMSPAQVTSTLNRFTNMGPVPGGYTEEKDGQGNVLRTADQARKADLDALFGDALQARVTRLRADLAYAALDADLVVTASQDQAEIPRGRQITRESGQPLCPIYDGCDYVGQAPRDEAISRSTTDAGGTASSCAVTPRSHTGQGWLAAGLGFVAVATLDALRRRRR